MKPLHSLAPSIPQYLLDGQRGLETIVGMLVEIRIGRGNAPQLWFREAHMTAHRYMPLRPGDYWVTVGRQLRERDTR